MSKPLILRSSLFVLLCLLHMIQGGGTMFGQVPVESGVPVEDCVVRFAEEVNVPAVETGILESVVAKLNQTIAAGDLLAQQKSDQVNLQLRIATLQKKAAEERLSDDLELQYARTAQAEAEAELASHRAIYEETAGAVSRNSIRKLELAVRRTELQVQQEQKRRRLAQVELDLRQADIQKLELNAERLKVHSPLPGVVSEVFRRSGEWATAGDPIVRIARLDRLHAHCLLTVDKLSPRRCYGQPVTVRWQDPEGERELRGRVISVDPELLTLGRYRLHVEIENVRDGQHWRLLPGTEVQMTVHPSAAVANPTIGGGNLQGLRFQERR